MGKYLSKALRGPSFNLEIRRNHSGIVSNYRKTHWSLDGQTNHRWIRKGQGREKYLKNSYKKQIKIIQSLMTHTLIRI